MRKIFPIIAVSFLIFLSSVSDACTPRPYTNEERVEKANSIYSGQVTGVRSDAVERSLDRAGSIEIGGNYPVYTLRVYVKQTLKGKMQKIVAPEIYTCGNGGARVGDSVLVFIDADGSSYVTSDKGILSPVKKILAKALTTQSR